MADLTLQNNPYGLFDPSQWSNPYSSFQSSPIPAASYAGWPTDAMGNPIQLPQGMTINQTPAQPAPAPVSNSNPQQWAFNNALLNSMGQAATNANINQVQSGLRGGMQTDGYNGPSINDIINMRAQNNRMYGMQGAGAGQGAPPPGGAQAAPASGANAAGLTPAQYMALRANPGRVVTPGATVPESPSSAQPGPGVLQQFLAGWKPASSGAGSGFQQGFYKALKGMGY